MAVPPAKRGDFASPLRESICRIKRREEPLKPYDGDNIVRISSFQEPNRYFWKIKQFSNKKLIGLVALLITRLSKKQKPSSHEPPGMEDSLFGSACLIMVFRHGVGKDKVSFSSRMIGK
jgi:hypothetical protein